MFRTTNSVFKIAVGSTPQPLFGSWVTAVSPATGFAQASGTALTLTLGSAMSSGNDATEIFQPGEPALLIDPNGAHAETVIVASILNNTVTLGPKTTTTSAGYAYPFTEFPHVAGSIGTGSFLIPKQLCSSFSVTFLPGGTGPYLYIGNYWAMTATNSVVYQLAASTSPAQPQVYRPAATHPGNGYDISEMFVFDVTVGDTYLVSLETN